MTSALNLLIVVSLAYVTFLFGVAFLAERAALRGRGGWLRLPIVYTLSLSIYCTAWTFYGAVGFAARSGLEYVTIYLGPTLVMLGWWLILRKLVRIGRSQRLTSIADLISSRYGKSNGLAVAVTLLSVIAATPYIALQLQSVVLSFATFAAQDAARGATQSIGGIGADPDVTALWVALGLAVFTVIFGTRNLDVNGRHHGVVMAIAVEAVVKLFALVAVGIFVVWGVAGGIGPVLARIDASPIAEWQVAPARWAGLTFLAAAAFLTLPRMFHVMVVENQDESHLRTASWAFPLYLLLMSLFVVPIAVVGLDLMPEGTNPDLFVLTVPLSQGREGLAMLSFLGGFSSATSMVIVAAIALSTMVSNHIVMPIWLRTTGGRASMSGDVRNVVLLSRRLSIAGVLFLGYLYFRMSGGGSALAAIGLISFTGVVQVLPAMLGGLFWRGATRSGALAGIGIGALIWLYTSFLPGFGPGVVLPVSVLAEGPWGIAALRPQALFGIAGMDPLIHAMVWSLFFNTGIFVAVSLITLPSALERLQGAQFVHVFRHSPARQEWRGGAGQAEDLLIMAQRILGPAEAQEFFRGAAGAQGLSGYLPEPTPEFLQALERELSGSVGAATAHAMVGQIVGRASVSVQDLLAVADETQAMLETSARLEEQSRELSRTAAQLREANDKLMRLSVQKDAFLSQISHELRTPMTSIRAFSEILRDAGEMSEADKSRYAGVIHDESVRLTRLLDDLLDLSVLESGQVTLHVSRGSLRAALNRAITAAGAGGEGKSIVIHRDTAAEDVLVETDMDRLEQVFINLIANAQKYCDAERPELTIRVTGRGDAVLVDFIDNGSGIPKTAQDVIFEKFSRLAEQKAGGAGLGLAICREIMARLGGSIIYLPGQGGAAFRLQVPLAQARAAE